MKKVMRGAGAALLGLLILYGIARGSLADYTPETPIEASAGMALRGDADGEVSRVRAGSALLRLSWRTRGESVHACRRLTAEELEALPMHMRREEVCESRIVPWHLRVELNGTTLVDDTVLPAGARQDRPLYVYRDLPLAPGRYDVAVRFEQILPESGRDSHDDDRRAGSNTTPTTLSHSATIEIAPGDIALITYDPDSRSLIMRQPSRADPVEPAATDIQPENPL